jgi:hypothetical protein
MYDGRPPGERIASGKSRTAYTFTGTTTTLLRRCIGKAAIIVAHATSLGENGRFAPAD